MSIRTEKHAFHTPDWTGSFLFLNAIDTQIRTPLSRVRATRCKPANHFHKLEKHFCTQILNFPRYILCSINSVSVAVQSVRNKHVSTPAGRDRRHFPYSSRKNLGNYLYQAT
jgi:hypothetical protein